MKNYLTVREFARFSGIEATTLRYWDEIGLFSPAKRDPDNNYRYYSSEQVIAVHFIYILSSLGVPLKAISEMAKERSPEKAIRLIEQQEKWLDMEMRRLRESYSIIHTRLEFINYGMKVTDGFNIVDGVRTNNRKLLADEEVVNQDSVAVLHRDDSRFVMGPRNEFKEDGSFYEPFISLGRQAEELRMNLAFPIAGFHDDMDAFLRAPARPDHFISMDPTGNHVRAAGSYLVGFSRGYYGQLGDLPKRMEACMQANGLTVTGPVYTMYLHDEVCVSDPSQYLAQVCVAVSGWRGHQ